MAGVIPTLPPLSRLPADDRQFFRRRRSSSTDHAVRWTYLLLEGFLIVLSRTSHKGPFNPIDQADNLRKHGGYIPGIRPGPPTAQYLDRVLTRLTLPGSIYLALVAIVPTFIIQFFDFSQATSNFLGGTSLLILVGVALDTMRQMESQMMARSYEGFLK
jgi:preprotein translocase subunit SecY